MAAKKDKRKPHEKKKPAEPRSPGVTITREQKDMPGEGNVPRREDMDPGDHRPREEDG